MPESNVRVYALVFFTLVALSATVLITSTLNHERQSAISMNPLTEKEADEFLESIQDLEETKQLMQRYKQAHFKDAAPSAPGEKQYLSLTCLSQNREKYNAFMRDLFLALDADQDGSIELADDKADRRIFEIMDVRGSGNAVGKWDYRDFVSQLWQAITTTHS